MLPKHHTAILVHGCFWHQHGGCRDARMPETGQDYWTERFRRNFERDEATAASLTKLGWNVAVIWECEARRPDLDDVLSGLLRD